MWDLTLSLLGMYNQDDEILDEDHLLLPDSVERDVLIPMILAESAELEVLYPNPADVKIVMAAWSAARRPSWERMAAALDAEYNPLHNYNRIETETGSSSETVTDAINDSSSSTSSQTDTGAVTGYNSGSFADADRKISSGTGSGTYSRNRSGGNTGSSSRSLHVSGNIGVTRTQEMLEDELEVRKTDIYRRITDEVISYFCLRVY